MQLGQEKSPSMSPGKLSQQTSQNGGAIRGIASAQGSQSAFPPDRPSPQSSQIGGYIQPNGSIGGMALAVGDEMHQPADGNRTEQRDDP